MDYRIGTLIMMVVIMLNMSSIKTLDQDILGLDSLNLEKKSFYFNKLTEPNPEQNQVHESWKKTKIHFTKFSTDETDSQFYESAE